ncbi:MAG: hypothetical protein ABGX16_08770 [Pirellulales bacterium]
MKNTTRRAFLQAAGWLSPTLLAPTLLAGGLMADPVRAETDLPSKPGDTYDTHAVGIRIYPGRWRPHYPWEHIAWVSPPWPSQDYLWLDFPEAIFTSQGLIYLSHINPPIHTVYPSLPRVPWKKVSGGIGFDRTLPNNISFGGRVTRGVGPTVDLELHISNESQQELTQITLQTCTFLRSIQEFADYSQDNKFVHTPATGWTPMQVASTSKEVAGDYRVGWRTSGKLVADLPCAVVISNRAKRLVAMTWFKDTLSLVGNPGHPCFHADPKFPDLPSGASASIRGKLIFFDGPLADFEFQNFCDH